MIRHSGMKSFMSGKIISYFLMEMLGQCVISSILSGRSKNFKWWMDQCYSSVWQLSFLRKQRKIHPWGRRVRWPKRCKEKRSPNPLGFLLLYICLLPPSLPYVNWASQEGCLFYLRSSPGSLGLPLFYFHGLSPSLSFSHHHSGLLFPILTP